MQVHACMQGACRCKRCWPHETSGAKCASPTPHQTMLTTKMDSLA
jgi:hypothetical protein